MLGVLNIPGSESMEHTINIYFASSLNSVVITFIFTSAIAETERFKENKGKNVLLKFLFSFSPLPSIFW